MNEKRILKKIDNVIDKAPIDILDNIKKAPKTKMLKHDDITRQEDIGEKKSSGKRFKKFLPYASVAIIFLIALVNWQIQSARAYGVFYLDVNPSIKFTTNRKDEVIDLKAGNSKGESIIEDIDFKDKTIEELTAEILERMLDKNFLEEGNEYILLSSQSKDQDKAIKEREELDSLIHKNLEEDRVQAIVLRQGLEKSENLEESAEKYKVSTAKMNFIRNIISLNGNFKEQDLVKLSIGDLVGLVEENNLNLEKIVDTDDMDKIKEDKQVIIEDEVIEEEEEERVEEVIEIEENREEVIREENTPEKKPQPPKKKIERPVERIEPPKKKAPVVVDDDDDDDDDDDEEDEEDDDDEDDDEDDD